MSGKLDLLRDAPNGEYSHIGICVGRRVPLKFHMGSRLLVYALDVLTTCGKEDKVSRERERERNLALWSFALCYDPSITVCRGRVYCGLSLRC